MKNVKEIKQEEAELFKTRENTQEIIRVDDKLKLILEISQDWARKIECEINKIKKQKETKWKIKNKY